MHLVHGVFSYWPATNRAETKFMITSSFIVAMCVPGRQDDGAEFIPGAQVSAGRGGKSHRANCVAVIRGLSHLVESHLVKRCVNRVTVCAVAAKYSSFE